jgi:Tfp pilus assembly protein PilF
MVANETSQYIHISHFINIRVCHLQAIQIDKNNPKAYYRMGQAYLEMADCELAKKHFLAAAKMQPKNKDIRYCWRMFIHSRGVVCVRVFIIHMYVCIHIYIYICILYMYI